MPASTKVHDGRCAAPGRFRLAAGRPFLGGFGRHRPEPRLGACACGSHPYLESDKIMYPRAQHHQIRVRQRNRDVVQDPELRAKRPAPSGRCGSLSCGPKTGSAVPVQASAARWGLLCSGFLQGSSPLQDYVRYLHDHRQGLINVRHELRRPHRPTWNRAAVEGARWRPPFRLRRR